MFSWPQPSRHFKMWVISKTEPSLVATLVWGQGSTVRLRYWEFQEIPTSPLLNRFPIFFTTNNSIPMQAYLDLCEWSHDNPTHHPRHWVPTGLSKGCRDRKQPEAKGMTKHKPHGCHDVCNVKGRTWSKSFHPFQNSTLQGTNISPKNGILKMMFLFSKVGYVSSLEGIIWP